MTRILRYTCRTELLPALETAQAADGYAIEAPFHRAVGGTAAMLMRKGTAFLLFSCPPTGQLVDIEIGGEAQQVAEVLLESLPLDLVKLPTLQTTE
ncbi:MAG TPA: hypothetical protein VFU22_20445 [Roseiflexaceae bacterium]|nr:hypothetical protein [Roseiflexaceae bacterium]